MCPIFKHNWVVLLCILEMDTILITFSFQRVKPKEQVPIFLVRQEVCKASDKLHCVFFAGIWTIKVTKIFPSTLFAPTNFIHLLPFFQHRHKDFFFHFANFFSKIRKHIRRRPACSAELNVKVFMYVWKGSRLSVLRYKKKRNGGQLDFYNQTSPRSLDGNENRVEKFS